MIRDQSEMFDNSNTFIGVPLVVRGDRHALKIIAYYAWKIKSK